MADPHPAARPWRALTLIALVAAAAHATVLGGEFLYDDLHAVRDNPAIRELGAIPSFWWDPAAFSSTGGVMYRPVVLTTLAWSHAVGDGAHLAFALFDLLLHAGCALLLWLTAVRLGVARRGATLAALLFAVHPLNAEAVHFVAARSDQLLLCGALLAVLGQVRALRSGGRARAGWAAAGGVLVACGAKESGVLVPGVLLVVEWSLCRGRLDWRAAARRLAPAAGVVAVYLLLRKLLLGIATAAPALGPGSGGDLHTGHGRDLITQLATMGELLPRLLVQSVVPVGLSIDPPLRFVTDPLAPTALAGWCALAALTALGVRAARRRPPLAVGLALCWAVALPWVLVPLNAPLMQNRAYGCVAGLALLAAPWLARLTRRRAAAPAAWWRAPRLRLAGLGVLVLAFAAGSVHRGTLLAEPRAAWQSALAWNSRSVQALTSLAQLHTDAAARHRARGDEVAAQAELQRSLQLLERAVAVRPQSLRARRGLVELRCVLGPQARGAMRAVYHAEVARATWPRAPFRRLNLCAAYRLAAQVTGDPEWYDRAVAAALSTLEIAEPKALVYRRAAEVRAVQGEHRAALELLDEAVRQGFDFADVQADRGRYLLAAGDTAGARRALRRALDADPMNGGARALLAELSAAGPPR